MQNIGRRPFDRNNHAKEQLHGTQRASAFRPQPAQLAGYPASFCWTVNVLVADISLVLNPCCLFKRPFGRLYLVLLLPLLQTCPFHVH